MRSTDSTSGLQLPDAAATIVARVVKRSRARGSRRRELADELTAHFLDGIESGETIDDIIAQFGSVELTADMIREANRLARPLALRALQKTVTVVLLCVGAIVLAYMTRAASLYLHEPFRSSQANADIDTAVDRIRTAWALTTPTAEAALTTARQINSTATERVKFGDPEARTHAIAHLRAISVRLRAEQSIAAELAALEIDEMRYDLILSGPQLPSGVLHLHGEPVKIEDVRSAFHDLIDEMYTRSPAGDGHLTGDGLKKLRRLKEWHEPTTKDKLMEPVWYALPASRRACEDRFDELVMVAETGFDGDQTPATVAGSLQPLRTVRECLRYPGISAVLKELYVVLAAAERCREKRFEILRRAAT